MSGILQELKRRNVIRVALAYLVLGWLLLQVGDVLFEALRLDDAALTIMLAILALGFIPVVIIAWVYELTPDGIRKESQVDRTASAAPQTGQRLNVAIVVLLAASLGLFAWDRFGATQTAAPEAGAAGGQAAVAVGEQSIAVLPFADMSTTGDQAYFGDGIAEELLNVLARVDGLKVAARTSSFKFRGAEHDIGEIGRALKVSTVLEGSVRKAGDQVRITAQLIEVEGGYHLWSQSYDRKLDNIFALQDEIAISIVDALKLQLQLEPDASTPAQDSGRAYELYLRGRELAREPSKDGLIRALGYYEEALAINPDFAAAHGGVASAWVWLEDYGGIQSQEAFDKAEPAARRALELDPNRADALTAMGFVEHRKYDNAAAAREYYEKALAINPAFTEAATLYADTVAALGEQALSLEIRSRAVERDPLSGFLKARLASQYVATGELAYAEQLLDEIFSVNPQDTYGHEELANLRFVQARFADAVDAYRFVHENRPGDPYSAANISAIYSLMGDVEDSERWIAAARARGAGNRWELEARRMLAASTGDWDALFRAGQLYLVKDGIAWQGEASLGKSDWEAARAAFQRTLSRMNYRPGTEPAVATVMALVGLALAEKRLGIDTWAEHAAAVRGYAQRKIDEAGYLGGWPRINLHHLLATVAAVEGDTDAVVTHMRAALDEKFYLPSFLEHAPSMRDLADEPRLIAIADEMRAHLAAEHAKL